MARKITKATTVGNLEKQLKVAPGTIKNADGRDTRSDKKLETLQKEAAQLKRAVKKKPATPAKPKSRVAKAKAGDTKSGAKTLTKTKAISRPKVDRARVVTVDQQVAARRTVKSHPKSAALVKQLRAALAAATKQLAAKTKK